MPATQSHVNRSGNGLAKWVSASRRFCSVRCRPRCRRRPRNHRDCRVTKS